MIEIDIIKDFPDFTLSAKFEVEKGLTVIFGPSGAGKSSIVNLITGLQTPQSGLIKVNDKTLFNSKEGINLPINRREIGHVFQDSLLFPHMSVEKTFSMATEGPQTAADLLRQIKSVTCLALSISCTANPRHCPAGNVSGWRSAARFYPIPAF